MEVHSIFVHTKLNMELSPAVVPLAVSAAHLLHDHYDAYPTALQLILLSCIVEILSSYGFTTITWMLMVPLLIFGTLGPVFTHVGNSYLRPLL